MVKQCGIRSGRGCVDQGFDNVCEIYLQKQKYSFLHRFAIFHIHEVAQRTDEEMVLFSHIYLLADIYNELKPEPSILNQATKNFS